MGYLLKEALKTLCGVNRWSYAVFWKIGSQNPRLLVWEECYYEPSSDSGYLDLSENATLENVLHESQGSRSIHLLVNKMMFNNHVVVFGQGLVGRAAFTEDYQWILSEDFYEQNHPPEVQKEVFQQFLGGIQTVAVIPVLPHGVIQFGSFLTIPENVEFVNDVASLVLQLGCLSGGLPSENYAEKGHTQILESSVSLGDFSHLAGFSQDTNVFDTRAPNTMNCYIYPDQASHAGVPLSGILPNVAVFSSNQASPRIIPDIKNEYSSSNQIFHSSVEWVEQPSSYNVSCLEPKVSSVDDTFSDLYDCGPSRSAITSSGFVLDFVPGMSTCNSVNFEQSTVNSYLSNGYRAKFDHKEESLEMFEESFAHPGSSDDLFDVLGADFKNKLLSGCSLKNESDMESCKYSPSFEQVLASLEMNKVQKDRSDNEILAIQSIVSKVPMASIDLSNSCQTTLTTMSSSFATNPSLSRCQSAGVSQCSYGSQLISLLENNQKANSVSTGHSKKTETGKTTRKRPKPGENPRPRPKDRQMIQDRVKELREIVPNGSKCSIDSLLERTIKHMLFLQSVMKHADKLKQSGESKIISSNDSMLSDSFQGGATWAYEVGSQSIVPPIVVENLNQPRQLRVEMLCEERGLFLEIADVIRGMGLTILKGVMETHTEKIWARFVVEANRDITRMEVFISLVHLLEQGAKS